MTTIEKAKFLNLRLMCGTLKGAKWEPSEEEVANFLRGEGPKGLGDAREQATLQKFYEMVRRDCTKEELAKFEAEQASLIAELAALGTATARRPGKRSRQSAAVPQPDRAMARRILCLSCVPSPQDQ